MKRTFYIIVVLFLTTSTWITAEDFGAAARRIGKEFSAAIAAHDAARVAAFYTQDAIAFPPNADMVKGREAIEALWKGFSDSGLNLQIEVLDTENEGKTGIETGTFIVTTPDGKTADQGKYVVVYKNEGGTWKLHRDIWNSSMPAPEPPK